MKEPLVISLGGSVIAPDGLDERYIRQLAEWVQLIARKRPVAIICGGGGPARSYIAAARTLHVRKADDLHWIGIRACQLNAELLRGVLRIKRPVIPDRKQTAFGRDRLLVFAPSKPGPTSDYGSVVIAHMLRASQVINITNVDGVYTADPRLDATARRLERLSWKAFHAMFDRRVRPGMHVPFDPLAARLAARHQIAVVVTSQAISNLQKLVAGTRFIGTTLADA